jgi:hypothetical protein
MHALRLELAAAVSDVARLDGEANAKAADAAAALADAHESTVAARRLHDESEAHAREAAAACRAADEYIAECERLRHASATRARPRGVARGRAGGPGRIGPQHCGAPHPLRV